MASVGEWSRTVILLGSQSNNWSSRMVCLTGQSFFRSSQLWAVSKNGPFWRFVQDICFFRKWSGQSFPRVDSFFTGLTMISVRGMAQLGECSRFSNQEQAFPRADSFSPGCTLFSARGMVQVGEWSRFNNQGKEFPRAYSFSPCFTMFSAEGMA